MKRVIYYLIPLVLLAAGSCEVQQQEVLCYPQRVTITHATGTNATAITADYKYEGQQVDRIIWSNSQTDYFTYNEEGLLTEVDKYNVKQLLKNEFVVSYDGERMKRRDEYLSRLDYQTQTEMDTTSLGYHQYVYEAGNITTEDIYGRKSADDGFELLVKNEYTYDINGNILTMDSHDMVGDSLIASYTYSYDYQKNPYKALGLFFEGESYVNNILEKVDILNEETYTYQIIYNESGYPKQINIKENGYLFQVIRMDYTCD